MALSAFTAAIQQICAEKGIAEQYVIEAIESALAAAYRKEYGHPDQHLRVQLGGEGDDALNFSVSQVYTVVADDAEIEDAQRELKLSDARMLKADTQIEEEVEVPLPFHDDFGRIAAQTAKQVIAQELREAEREVLYTEFKDKEGRLLNATVQQVDGDVVYVSLGKINGVLPAREQMRGEFFSVGQRVKVYVKEVSEGFRGPQIIVSRADARFILELFMVEVPEIAAGTVEIKGISREGGSRTKMAVWSTVPGIDPVGSCVGQRGTRVQAVLSEINGEKIDIVLWDQNPEVFITNALSPAKIRSLSISSDEMRAKVEVDPDQLSLVIGKGGQNVRLASKLTGYTLDVVRDEVEGDTETGTESETEVETETPAEA